jgi:hypothetical protein
MKWFSILGCLCWSNYPLHITNCFINWEVQTIQSPPRSSEPLIQLNKFHRTMSMKWFSIFRRSLVWFIWAISVLCMVWIICHNNWAISVLHMVWSCLLHSSGCSSAAVQQWWLPRAAPWPVAEGKTTTPFNAADAAETGGSEGEGVDEPEGFMLQASDDEEEVAPAAT